MAVSPSLGPVMLDLEGLELTAEEREILAHPAVGGLILFARNYHDHAQLTRLTADIHALREPRIPIGVDQEGGRVQRFRDGFVRLPAAGGFGALHRIDPGAALAAAEDVGWLMAAELRAAGVDFSFAPVLDLDRGVSRVIGDRGFAAEPAVVCDLAGAWLRGTRAAGMVGCGKHFPGHGGVVEDSHLALPVDHRPLVELEREDMVPFARLIAEGLEAVMPAHVIYAQIDPNSAGFSAFWLRDVLRQRLGFDGVIFSDDLNMAAAGAGGGYAQRAALALDAGCDQVLVCNNRAAAIAVIEAFGEHPDPAAAARLARMRARGTDAIRASVDVERHPRRARALAAIARLQHRLVSEPTG